MLAARKIKLEKRNPIQFNSIHVSNFVMLVTFGSKHQRLFSRPIPPALRDDAEVQSDSSENHARAKIGSLGPSVNLKKKQEVKKNT